MKTYITHSVFFVILAYAVFPLAAQEPSIYTEKEENEYLFYADNHLPVEVWISLSFPQLVNMEASVPLPYAVSLQPNETRKYLFKVSIQASTRSSRYQLTTRFAIGNPLTATHDEQHVYYFPFKHGEKFKLSQGYHGTFSHSGTNAYAVDFEMDEGTEIHAARDGIVAAIKEDSRIGGRGFQYGGHENYILILHEDGSIGSYVHLRYGGAIVELGDDVYAGQIIGHSGNTGLSTGPHLHFSVDMPQMNGSMQSIPARFLYHDGTAISPEEGGYYYGFHPGKEAFPVIFGTDLRAEDFADHRISIAESKKIEITTDTLDDTSIIYIQNGTTVAKTIILSARLRGMQSSHPLPITLEIPPLTEVFATLLRTIPGAQRASYQLNISTRQTKQ